MKTTNHDDTGTRDDASGSPGEGSSPLRLIQISDPHLFGDPDSRLLGIRTRPSFEAVLEMALEQPQPADAIVITGDLVHDNTPAGYEYLREKLDAISLPCFCVAGNHDAPQLMERILGARAPATLSCERLGEWDFLLLNSTLPRSDAGYIDATQMKQLELHFEESPERATLLFLHHHPIEVNSAWMDTMGVTNREPLLELLARYRTRIPAIVFGHIHQEFSATTDGIRMLAAPSTCVQFLPRSQTFAVDDCPPGYRELLLYPNGTLDTRIVRLARALETPQLRSHGY